MNNKQCFERAYFWQKCKKMVMQKVAQNLAIYLGCFNF
jgi:hypothetical protein